MQKLFKKVLLIVFFIFVYFLGIRSVRESIVAIQRDSIIELVSEKQELTVELQSVSFKFDFHRDGFDKELTSKLSFGMFFLFAVIGFIVIDTPSRMYYILLGIHLIGAVLVTSFTWISLKSNPLLLTIPDFLSRYLIPLSSFGLVALSYLQKKKLVDEA